MMGMIEGGGKLKVKRWENEISRKTEEKIY